MRKGFTLIEILVTVAVIAVLAAIMLVAFGGAKDKARDSTRKAEVSTFGRFLTLGCFVPAAGAGDYDLAGIVAELRLTYPQYSQQLSRVPQDPKAGSPTESHYRYVVNTSGKCALYANFESDEPATLTTISAPTPGGGSGIFHVAVPGWNGSKTYFQYSN